MQLSAKNIFLIDGIGATITGLSLSLLLTTFESFFGMPTEILHVLAALAFAFAVYSLLCYLLKLRLRPFLYVIMLANVFYCLTTGILVVLNFESLTGFGIAYFAGEIIIVLGLVRLEYGIASGGQ